MSKAVNVLVDMPARPEGLDTLRALPGVNIGLADYKAKKRPLPGELIRDAEVLFCTYPPENFSEMAAVKLIQISSAGYSQLFDLSLVERGIRACNARGCFDVPVAEWYLAMMINLARDLRSMFRNQEAGVWDPAARFQNELRGSVVGIWGYGGIGRETARLAKAFGLKVYVMSRRPVAPSHNVYAVPHTGDTEGLLPDRQFLSGQEFQFLSELDFLVLAMPLTKVTEGLIGERELRALRPAAFVLNAARGPIIQEKALVDALSNGWIAGAALDAHHHYPMPPDHPLWRFPNVIITPHISGNALNPHYLERIWNIFLENLKRYLAGHKLVNEISSANLLGQ